jgi:hypothetical protein
MLWDAPLPETAGKLVQAGEDERRIERAAHAAAEDLVGGVPPGDRVRVLAVAAESPAELAEFHRREPAVGVRPGDAQDRVDRGLGERAEPDGPLVDGQGDGHQLPVRGHDLHRPEVVGGYVERQRIRVFRRHGGSAAGGNRNSHSLPFLFSIRQIRSRAPSALPSHPRPINAGPTARNAVKTPKRGTISTNVGVCDTG